MTPLDTAWGEISAMFISGGCGKGEVHISHEGQLYHEPALVSSVAATFKFDVRSSRERKIVLVQGRSKTAKKLDAKLTASILEAFQAAIAAAATPAPTEEPKTKAARRPKAVARG